MDGFVVLLPSIQLEDVERCLRHVAFFFYLRAIGFMGFRDHIHDNGSFHFMQERARQLWLMTWNAGFGRNGFLDIRTFHLEIKAGACWRLESRTPVRNSNQ